MATRDSIPKQIVEAVKAGNVTEIRRLFAEHPEQLSFETPFGGQTWLGYAAQVGNLEVARTLVAMGADINHEDAREGTTALTSAADSGHVELVRFLLKEGAKLKVDTSVRNPLFAAIVGRSTEIVELLLRAGVDSRVRYTTATMKDMDAVAFALMRGERECALRIAAWNAGGDMEEAERALARADLVAEQNARMRS